MQYVSDRLFTKVSGAVGDAFLTGNTPSLVTRAAVANTPNVMATDAEGRELFHMDRSARAAGKKGVRYGALSSGLGGAAVGGIAGGLVGRSPAAAALGALGYGALGAGLGALGGAIAAPAAKRNAIRMKGDAYYRDPGKSLGASGIAL